MMAPAFTRLMRTTVAAAVLAAGAGASAQEPGEGQKPVAALNTIAEVFAALEACWIPPGLEQARAGMQITVMLSFKRNGELLGKPRITYETPGCVRRRADVLPGRDGAGGAPLHAVAVHRCARRCARRAPDHHAIHRQPKTQASRDDKWQSRLKAKTS